MGYKGDVGVYVRTKVDQAIDGVKTFLKTTVFNKNLSIGKTPASWKASSINALEIMNASLFSGSVISSNPNVSLTNNSYVGSDDLEHYKLTGIATKYVQNANGHTWYNAISGSADGTIPFGQYMLLDMSGNNYVFGNMSSGYSGASYASGEYSVSAFGGASNSSTVISGRNASDIDTVFKATVAGTIKAQILATGSYQSATNSYGATSDLKLKENIDFASSKLDKLMQVKVRTFNYKGQEDKQIGVIAQELEEVFPSLIFETEDKDDNGNKTGEKTKNVKYSVLYMIAIKAMQEQQEIIKNLQLRIETIEKGLDGDKLYFR